MLKKFLMVLMVSLALPAYAGFVPLPASEEVFSFPAIYNDGYRIFDLDLENKGLAPRVSPCEEFYKHCASVSVQEGLDLAVGKGLVAIVGVSPLGGGKLVVYYKILKTPQVAPKPIK